MSREQERIRRKLESNPAVECNRVRNSYCPDLFCDLAATKDPRNPSYTEYSNVELLGTMFYKGIAGIVSMQSMTYEFNREQVVENLFRFMGSKKKEYLPHAVTINEYFERLDPDELQKVQQKQVYGLIRSKAFYDARFQKKWLVIVDGTQTYSGNRKLNEGCLERHYNKGTDEQKPHKRKLMRRGVQRAQPFVQGYRECNFPVQVKGGSHCPVEVMLASLRTGYCLTLESAGLAAKLPFSHAALMGENERKCLVPCVQEDRHFPSGRKLKEGRKTTIE